jgi:hypothetical protein
VFRVSRDELDDMLAKYREMVRMREADLAERPPDPRDDMRRLARRFPGALREIDQLALEELRERLRAVERAVSGGEVPRWLEWCSSYHRLLRAALDLRAKRPCDDLPADLERRLAKPPGGRLNPLVFEWIAERAGVQARDVERAIFPGHPPKRNPAAM